MTGVIIEVFLKEASDALWMLSCWNACVWATPHQALGVVPLAFVDIIDSITSSEDATILNIGESDLKHRQSCRNRQAYILPNGPYARYGSQTIHKENLWI